MTEEDICNLIEKTIQNLQTAYIWLVDGPMYIVRFGEVIEYHEDSRINDMKRIKDNIEKLNNLFEELNCTKKEKFSPILD